MRKSRILITGASGQLGSYLLRAVERDPELEVVAWSGSVAGERFGASLRVVDVRDHEQIATAFEEDRPDLMIHAAAVCRVDLCYSNPELAEQVNVTGTSQLVERARQYGSRLVYVSTDLVFDGERGGYCEEDAAAPVSCYGRSKLAGERAVLELPSASVARVSLLFGPSLNGRPSFFDQQCAALRKGGSLTLFTDEWRTPLSLTTAASALVQLAKSQAAGILHIGGPERMSRWEMGRRLAEAMNGDPAQLVAGRQRDAQLTEPRPRDVSLDSSRWRGLFPQHPWPSWNEAMRELGIS